MQEKLREELQEALQETCSATSPPSFESIEGLHYLNNTVKEVLRFFPPVPMTLRTAIVSATIDGTYVPAGTQLFICTISTNKNPEIWGPTAEQFDPDRWDALPSTHNNYGMETFLHGSRGCIGQRFAIIEMKCLLASILMAFKVEKVGSGEIEVQGGITQRPKGGLRVKLTPL